MDKVSICECHAGSYDVLHLVVTKETPRGETRGMWSWREANNSQDIPFSAESEPMLSCLPWLQLEWEEEETGKICRGPRQVDDTPSDKTRTFARAIFLKHGCHHPCLFFKTLLFESVIFTLWLSESWGLRWCLKPKWGPGAEFESSARVSLGKKMIAANNRFKILSMKRIWLLTCHTFIHWIFNGWTEIWRANVSAAPKRAGEAGAGVRVRENMETEEGRIGKKQPMQNSTGFVRKFCLKSNGEPLKTLWEGVMR